MCKCGFFSFLWLHLRHMEFPRLGVKSELHLLAYTTATAMWDLSCISNLHRSLWQHQILNSLSEARGQTHIRMDASQVLNPLSHSGNSTTPLFNRFVPVQVLSVLHILACLDLIRIFCYGYSPYVSEMQGGKEMPRFTC